jgi:serine/threonine protein kinase
MRDPAAGVTGGVVPRLGGDLEVGSILGRYRIDEPVGRGGMGVVYRAYDAATNRNVALKLLAPGLSPGLRDRFLHECEAEAQIRHEHVMPVYDQGWYSEEQPYFVMELLYEPVTLDQIVELARKGKLGATWPRIRKWAQLAALVEDVLLPVAEGIAVANLENRYQHRDLKPENVLIDLRTRRPYVIDFGICRKLDEPNPESGKIIGTPRFLSPEQARGGDDPTTDVWGLGALLRYAITGDAPLAATSPFRRQELVQRIEALREAEQKARAAGETAKATSYAERREQLEAPDVRTTDDLVEDARTGRYLPLPDDVSPAYLAIVRKAMAVEPAERYRDAAALVSDLRAWSEGRTVTALQEFGARGAALDRAQRLLRRHRTGLIAGAAGLLAGALLGVAFASRPPPPADHRAADARQDLAALSTLWSRAARHDRALGFQRALGEISVGDLAAVQARLGTGSPSEAVQVDGLRAVLAPVPLDLVGAGTPQPLQDLLFPEDTPGGPVWRAGGTGGSRADVPRGWWRVRAARALDAAVYVPGPTTVRLPAEPARIPAGMSWVLDPRAPFLAADRLVTYERYEEWLDDDVPPDQRGAHLPPTGFVRDPSTPGRWIAETDLRGLAVTGLRLADIQAYAAWRTEVEGLELRLPEEGEWEALAGRPLLGLPGSDLVVVGTGATPDGRRSPRAVRRGGALAGPYGHTGHLGGPRELVTTASGHGLKGGPHPPTDSGLGFTEAWPGGRIEGGFRLVHRPGG